MTQLVRKAEHFDAFSFTSMAIFAAGFNAKAWKGLQGFFWSLSTSRSMFTSSSLCLKSGICAHIFLCTEVKGQTQIETEEKEDTRTGQVKSKEHGTHDKLWCANTHVLASWLLITAFWNSSKKIALEPGDRESTKPSTITHTRKLLAECKITNQSKLVSHGCFELSSAFSSLVTAPTSLPWINVSTATLSEMFLGDHTMDVWSFCWQTHWSVVSSFSTNTLSQGVFTKQITSNEAVETQEAAHK